MGSMQRTMLQALLCRLMASLSVRSDYVSAHTIVQFPL
jgi:hypothetical protein